MSSEAPPAEPFEGVRRWLGRVAVLMSVVWLFEPLVDLSDLQCARRDTALLDLRTIRQSLKRYQARTRAFPTAQEGLAALVPAELERLPGDPWGRPYQYSLSPCGPVVSSLGPIAEPGARPPPSERLAVRWTQTWSTAVLLQVALRDFGRLKSRGPPSPQPIHDWRERWQPFAVAPLLLVACVILAMTIVMLGAAR